MLAAGARGRRAARSTAGCWRARSSWWTSAARRSTRYDSPRLVRAVEALSTTSRTGTCALSRAALLEVADDADKRAAYETLWYALVQLSRCVAPVMPFLADELWQNLVRGVCADAPDSVHLVGLPRAVHPALADDALVAEMDSVRTVVRAGPPGPRTRRRSSCASRWPRCIVATDDPEPAREDRARTSS